MNPGDLVSMDTETTTPITARRRVSRVMQHCTAAAPAFRYSLDSAETEGVLTRAQREFYEQNGYIVIKRLVPEAALARYNERFQQYCTGARPMPDNMTMMRDVELIRARGGGAAQAAMGEDNITKLQHFHMDRELFAYSRLPEVVRYVRAFCGPNVKSVHTMLINKPLDLGKGSSRHPPHQDLWYFPFRPGRPHRGVVDGDARNHARERVPVRQARVAQRRAAHARVPERRHRQQGPPIF